jgi:hypothetical protein
LDALEKKELKKFGGSFDALTKMGAKYYNDQRFKALIGDGKPLWEFKEFDGRIYCFRRVVDVENVKVDVVLFNGWIKDKKGKNKEELSKVATAKTLLTEFLTEYPGGKI